MGLGLLDHRGDTASGWDEPRSLIRQSHVSPLCLSNSEGEEWLVRAKVTLPDRRLEIKLECISSE